MSRDLLPVYLVLLALALPAAAGASAAAGAERTESSPSGAFSITFPSSWRVVANTYGDSDQLSLFSGQPMDVSIVVGSRPLDAAERALERRELLDRMIERTMINTAELGNEIVEVGRVEPLVEGWPAFAAVATTRDRAKMITILRSFVHDRAYVVTTLTDNSKAGPELGATVERIVRSLTLRPPAPAGAETPGLRRLFCERW